MAFEDIRLTLVATLMGLAACAPVTTDEEPESSDQDSKVIWGATVQAESCEVTGGSLVANGTAVYCPAKGACSIEDCNVTKLTKFTAVEIRYKQAGRCTLFISSHSKDKLLWGATVNLPQTTSQTQNFLATAWKKETVTLPKGASFGTKFDVAHTAAGSAPCHLAIDRFKLQ